MSFHRYVIGIILLLIPGFVYPAIRHVPAEYPTIQLAIDAADDGDTILIADGIYSGEGNFDIQWDAHVKHLVIMSENGRDFCFMDCLGEGRGFTLNNGQDERDVVEGVTITNGFVDSYAGAILILSTSPRIINCRLENNTSGGDYQSYGGGAIAVYDSAAPVIQGNIIRGNSANLSGGGIHYNQFSSGVLENNIIDGNRSGREGGGGIEVGHFSSPLIINNLIINNYSDSDFDGGLGGGISTSHSGPLIVNNTIAFNSTGNKFYGGHGGGIAITKWLPQPVIRNCIIWYNESGPTSMNIQFPSLMWMDISYCNVEDDLGHIFDLKPHTNIDSMPEFMDPENGNYQLFGSSTSINRGTPDTTGLLLPAEDLSGNERILEGRVDIGAYENPGATSTPTISDETDFQLYPNPSSGLLVMESREHAEHQDLVVRICNVRGEIVREEPVDAAKTVIPVNITNQPDGIYILTLTSKQGLLFRQKIIKE